MRLYSIKRKKDGKFYVSAMGTYAIHTGAPQYLFATKPQQFLKTADGVAGNLRKLCSEPFYDYTRPDSLSPNITRWKELAWRNFNASKLTLYEIVIMDIDIISMTATPAEDFAQIDAIEFSPLTRSERKQNE